MNNKCEICGGETNGRYKKCYACRASSYRTRTKVKAVACKGGKCQICGYDRCLSSLVFHHLNPKEKEFNITTGNNKSWARVEKELEKCILLCRNCHGEVHAGLINIGSKHVYDKAAVRKTSEMFTKYIIEGGPKKKKIISERECKQCGNSYTPEKEKGIYCSSKCSHLNQRRAMWPNKEELEKLVWEKPTTILAQELGVSDKAVDKWCKKYGIDKPSRGYWMKIRARGGQ